MWCDWNVFESIVNSQGRGKDRGRAGVIRAGLGFEDRMLVCYLRLEYGLYRTVLYCTVLECTVLCCTVLHHNTDHYSWVRLYSIRLLVWCSVVRPSPSRYLRSTVPVLRVEEAVLTHWQWREEEEAGSFELFCRSSR